MIFTFPSKQVLPVVALLSCLIAEKGISALDMDMTINNNNQPESSSNGNEGRELRPNRPSPRDRNHTKQSPEQASVGKIIGGVQVDADEYPWFARGTSNNHNRWWGCGASLVTPEFVLSAAHCGFDTSGGFQIGALCSPYGPSESDNCDQKIEEFDIDAVFDHDGYDNSNLNNDFSLIRLSGRSSIAPVPMDTNGLSNGYTGGEILHPIGFGETGSGSSNHLLDVPVPYVTNVACNSQYNGGIFSAMMCAGDLYGDGGEDACQGDSGGPLYDTNAGTLVGVTSWGIGCAMKEYPGVYARISDQWEEWIKPTICENHSNPKPSFCSSGPTPPSPTPPSPTPPTPSPCESDEDLFKFTMTTDSYGEDISWVLKQRNDAGKFRKLLESDKEYGDNQLFVEEYCVPKNECYRFIILDSYGDGLCCAYGEGSYEISLNGSRIKKSSFEEKRRQRVPFGNC